MTDAEDNIEQAREQVIDLILDLTVDEDISAVEILSLFSYFAGFCLSFQDEFADGEDAMAHVMQNLKLGNDAGVAYFLENVRKI